MLIINERKQKRRYNTPEMPKFSNRRTEIMWLKIQKMESELINIKSVSVQIKDINQMIYSENQQLISLYATYARQQLKSNLHNESFITFDKSKKDNKQIIYALLNADWILNIEDLENKSVEELEQVVIDLDYKIQKLLLKENSCSNKGALKNRIKLLKYKLSCIKDYLSENMKESIVTNEKTRKLSNRI